MRILGTILLVVCTAAAAAAQTAEPAEKAATPAEVDALHAVIADAMHGPVEEGDAAATAAMLPEIGKANAALQTAELSEAYADVEKDFARARERMNKAVAGFVEAVEAKDSAAILAGMLAVHETMSRVEAALSGMCYEVVALHDVIAPIQHRALPDRDWAAIREALAPLKERIEALKAAEVPARHEAVRADLAREAGNLAAAWQELHDAVEKDDPKAIETAFGKIHDHFHSCMELFQ